MKRRKGESGQALIIAVLVMLVLAALGGYFAALLWLQANQAVRENQMVRALQIAEAGLDLADDRLTNGPEGADWRPPQPYFDFGDGRCEISVSFTPGRGDAYSSRYIRVESTARLYEVRPPVGPEVTPEEVEAALNPFVRRTRVMFKAIGITDYTRFVTNTDRRDTPTALGVPLQIAGEPYLTRIVGPVRVQGDLTWYGPVRLELGTENDWATVPFDPDTGSASDHPGVPWGVEVAGLISHDPSSDIGVESGVCVAAGSDAWRVQPSVPASGGAPYTTVQGRYRDGMMREDADGFARWTPRYEPPALSEKRYLALTRDSGIWKRDKSEGGRWYNTGWYPNPDDADGDGLGDGILIDNSGEVQFSHDIEALRQNLMGLRPEYWDAPRNRLYAPPGVEIVLDPGSRDDPTTARITITRRDGGFYKPNPQTMEKLGRVSTISVPYPKNGVIYAQGNVRLRGALPPRTFGDPGSKYWADANRRHFSLTVVSGGTIYVEGNILGPRTMDATLSAARDSKIALLAADSVVLNTTRFQGMNLVQGQLASDDGQGYVPYEVSQDRPLEFEFALGSGLNEMLTQTGSPNLQLLVLHAGAPAAPPGAGGESIVQLLFNHLGLGLDPPRDGRFDWSQCSQLGPLRSVAGAQWTYDPSVPGYTLQYYYWLSPTAGLGVNASSAVAPVLEGKSLVIYDPLSACLHPLPNAVREQQRSYLVQWNGEFGAAEPGVVQRLRFEVPYASQNRYWLYNLAVQPLDIEVDALIYAQRGNWFVIPGQSFVTQGMGALAAGFPAPEEPLDIRVTVRGAIAENAAAPLQDVMAWTQRWRGADARMEDFTALPGDETNILKSSRRQLQYVFDPGLRSLLNIGDPDAPADDDAAGPLRIPHLPVCPGRILFGERI